MLVPWLCDSSVNQLPLVIGPQSLALGLILGHIHPPDKRPPLSRDPKSLVLNLIYYRKLLSQVQWDFSSWLTEKSPLCHMIASIKWDPPLLCPLLGDHAVISPHEVEYNPKGWYYKRDYNIVVHCICICHNIVLHLICHFWGNQLNKVIFLLGENWFW